ncbi:MAG: ATP synthase F1 subunit gamma [bacterium]
MAISTKIIKARLRSIGNTKKITRAMEMVAAAKMRKTVNAVLASRAYSSAAWQTVLDLAGKVDPLASPLLKKPSAKEATGKIGVIIITSNRGLCGGFNLQVINSALHYLMTQQQSGQPAEIIDEWIVMGKRGGEFLVRNRKKVVAEFDKLDVATEAEAVAGLARLVMDDYLSGKYDKIMIAYTDFVSALIQKPRIKQLLPIEPVMDAELGTIGRPDKNDLVKDDLVNKANEIAEYLFEPNPTEVLNRFLPRLVQIQLFQALLESNASEHSARMLAMRNASDAAGEMIDDLTLTYNQARQAGITREIAEISGGKAALE